MHLRSPGAPAAGRWTSGLLLALVVGSGCAGEVGPEPTVPSRSTEPEAEQTAKREAATERPSRGPRDVPDELFADVEAKPDDIGARRRLAIALYKALRRHEAVEQFERLVELSPTPRHLFDLAVAYGAVSRFEQAESTYRRVLASEPDHAVTLHNLGDLTLRRGEPERAIELYRRAIEAEPRYLLARYRLGDALTQAERFEEAYREFEAVLELEPSKPEELKAWDDSLYRLASLDLAMGATERAAQLLAELVAARPDHPKAHYAYGQALVQLGREREAEREFEIHMRLLAGQEPEGPVATRE
jgi:tetratricopeptide (TPR) repeat protein